MAAGAIKQPEPGLILETEGVDSAIEAVKQEIEGLQETASWPGDTERSGHVCAAGRAVRRMRGVRTAGEQHRS